jgi:hypothetical protein
LKLYNPTDHRESQALIIQVNDSNAGSSTTMFEIALLSVIGNNQRLKARSPCLKCDSHQLNLETSVGELMKDPLCAIAMLYGTTSVPVESVQVLCNLQRTCTRTTGPEGVICKT